MSIVVGTINYINEYLMVTIIRQNNSFCQYNKPWIRLEYGHNIFYVYFYTCLIIPKYTYT